MNLTVLPTSRWISLTLNFPGVGSITRDRSIHKPVDCSAEIAAKLTEKFYAKLVETTPANAEEETNSGESAPAGQGSELVPPTVQIPAEDPIVVTPLDRLLAAINLCETVDQLKELGLNPAKAVAAIEALPLSQQSLTDLIPAKVLTALAAKFE
jgi:hypothetical protein